MPYFIGECSTLQRALGRFSAVLRRHEHDPINLSVNFKSVYDLHINTGKPPPLPPKLK